jgi:uncharacterized protein involved in type VI secretion and phage assembly
MPIEINELNIKAGQLPAGTSLPGTLVKTSIELQNKKINTCVGLVLTQDLFNHHRFEVTVPFSELEDGDTAFFSSAHQQVVGQVIKISFAPQLTDGSFDFQFKGIVTGITLKQKDLSSVFVLKGFSPTIALEDNTRRQTYSDKSLSDIYNAVLGDYPANVLKKNINPRTSSSIKYAAQYNESNFHFLNRLAAEYGEWFYYDGTQLCLGDPDDSNAKDFKVDGIQSCDVSIGLQAPKFNVSAYDYTQDQTYQSAADGQTVEGLSNFGSFAMDESQQLFSNESNYVATNPAYSSSDVEDQVKTRKSIVAGDMVTFRGNGVTPELTVGQVIKVSGSVPQIGGRSDDDSFGDYRITSIIHRVDQNGNYSSNFTAIPKTLKMPPTNTNVTKPVGRPELAVVSDNQDPDSLGRVRCNFMWGGSGDMDSGWVRVGTFYSGGGDGKGCLFIPEIGAQVMIGYEQNDPNYPFVITSMYPKQSDTRTAQSQNSEKIIYTTSGNIIDFSDASGSGSITISNSNMTGTAITLSFSSNGSIEIKTDGTIDLKSGQDMTLGGQNVTIKADQKLSLQGSDVEVSAQQGLTASGNSQVEISSSATLKMSGAQSELDGNAMLTLKGGMVMIN